MKICTQCRARFTGNPARCPLDGAPLAEMPDPLIGKSLGGRYRVEKKIGAGGMAAVYLASHDLLGRKVAIKFLSPEYALDPTQKERFLREARATNRIKHEHIIDITDYGEEENGIVYLVMELLEGETLADVIARGPVPPREAIDYAVQICRALARAHELEVIHRDLKAENVFVTLREGKPHLVLLDFGLAHVSSEARLTAMGSVFGTPEYMSPEQARGQAVGPATDLYSLGVVLFEMLTSRLPFEGSTAELIVKHLSATPPTPSSLVRSLPHEMDAVIAKMLSKNAAQRHRDAYHLMDELSSLLTLLPAEPSRTLVELRKKSEPNMAALRMATERPAAPTTPDISMTTTTTPMSVRAWTERRAAFRRAHDEAYRSRTAPEWVIKTIDVLEALVDRAVTVESEMAKVARALAEQEQLASDVRDRIGRALDELARDESAVLRQIEDLERRAERARQRATQVAGEYLKAWSEALAVVDERTVESVEAVHAIEVAARRGTAWRQGVQEIDENRRLLELRCASCEDLRFQVTQLKGRMAGVNAEVEHDLSGMRDRATELAAQMARTQEQLAEAGASLSQHFMEVPAARAHVVATN